MVSILVPPGCDGAPRVTLPAAAVHDLALDWLAHELVQPGTSESSVRRLLSELPQDPREIRYRQEVMQALRRDRRLTERLVKVAHQMRELTAFARTGQESERPLLEAIWRLGELELYVELVESLAATVKPVTPECEAFRLLGEELERRRIDPAFDALRTELPGLRAGLKLHQSLTIGVNLDDRLRPVEAALLSVNDQRFREGQFMHGFLGKAIGDPYVTRTPLHRSTGAELQPGRPTDRLPLAPLFEELDDMLRAMLRPLARQLRSYMSVNTEIFRRLLPELGFYLGAVRYFHGLERQEPLCFPEILEPAERTLSFTGLYNLRLAGHRTGKHTAPLVGNDISFDEDARVYVLTGPNGGGKTTFTQAVGIATVLGMCGLPVPAVAARLSPVDRLHTHFPVEETVEDELGRFEEEAQRISQLFDSVTDRSLVLLNEPLASTGPSEAQRIAASVLSGLRAAGSLAVFTTHFHDLAMTAQEINGAVDGASRIGTLSAGVRWENGRAERTYRITREPPSGTSYADDIARRYAIDRETLLERVRRGRP